jgi:hypothetical protein
MNLDAQKVASFANRAGDTGALARMIPEIETISEALGACGLRIMRNDLLELQRSFDSLAGTIDLMHRAVAAEIGIRGGHIDVV